MKEMKIIGDPAPALRRPHPLHHRTVAGSHAPGRALILACHHQHHGAELGCVSIELDVRDCPQAVLVAAVWFARSHRKRKAARRKLRM